MEQYVAKRIPYGVSDFIDIIERNQYYVDKTMYLPLIEDEADSLFFIRPRRFGKSLMISMMRAYYDINRSSRFQELFGKLWIGSHPTPLQGKFQVLYLDFSRIGGNIDNLEERFNEYCGQCIDFFIENQYRDYYSQETIDKVKKVDYTSAKLNAINLEAREKGYQLYLIVDEYDNFTNVVLKVFKGMFSRIFMTGVSPVTLDDLTSGFNIGWHISTKEKFNQMLGFSTEDVREMINYFKETGQIRADADTEAIIADMKPWYDNYCFSKNALKTQSKVFNCDMVLYYLRNYMEAGEAPEQMIDPNTKTDYNKMKKLLQLDKLDGDRKGVLMEIIEKGEILGNIEESFPASALTNPDIFVSLLFYYGMLTIKGTRGAKLILAIPNNNVRKQYYNYLRELYEVKGSLNTGKLTDYYYDMAYDGTWREGLQYMADSYAKVSSVRDGIEAERNLQGFFMAYLNLNTYYYTAPELELNHGYCDFFLLPDLTHYATKHSYILELKVLYKKEFDEEANDAKQKDGTPMTKAEKQWQDAVQQINRYAVAPRVEALRQGTQLHKIIMQFKGWELARIEEV